MNSIKVGDSVQTFYCGEPCTCEVVDIKEGLMKLKITVCGFVRYRGLYIVRKAEEFNRGVDFKGLDNLI